ncbi:TIGR02449 family protein [Geopseudomonas guangdongensis]|uniref:Cell division protein ZapB n=1 Tax=Geopseudomonas guangdongensis TaxID=1245526 RepID=A0A1H2FI91_9GAMM|nr:TIGR02449 family protein [Pseudomonas guangdongensis]MBP9955982.1 TIGR02449 family protein [Pseudomonas sp.]SDU07086.1 cell division protein ZapB [Pseudomonas guangdongensis]
MADDDLTLLAAKLDQLIRLNDRLREENLRLRAGELQWREERARLLERQQRARQTVESVISRLTALEQDP